MAWKGVLNFLDHMDQTDFGCQSDHFLLAVCKQVQEAAFSFFLCLRVCVLPSHH